jgi:ABC-2 type transport system ATP-binding protein
VQVDAADPAVAGRVLTGLGLTGLAPTPAGVIADLGAADPEQVLAALVAAGAGVRQFVLHRPTLEDLFVTLTGEGFDVER